MDDFTRGLTPVPKLLTIAEASRLSGRSVRLLQRWVHDGQLPVRYRQANWPYGFLVTEADLAAASNSHPRWGRRRHAQTLLTEGGRTVNLQG
jgi:hypothetical protein